MKEIKEGELVGSDFCGDIIPQLIGRIYAWHTREPLIDIGTVSKLNKAQSELEREEIE